MAGLLNEDFVTMTEWQTMQNLRYYFGHQHTVQTPLIYFYQRLPLPSSVLLAMDFPCIVMASEFVPGKQGPFDAYSHPSEWSAFVEWSFAFEYGRDGEVASSREFEVVSDNTGEVYVVLSLTKQAVAGIQDVLLRLDMPMGGDGATRHLQFLRGPEI